MVKKSRGIKGKYLGIAVLVGLGIQYILPQIGIRIDALAVAIYLFVGLYLLLS